jgi:hypothetical protein
VGRYEVIFNRDVRTCAYLGTIGTPTTTLSPPGKVVVAQKLANLHGVVVATFDNAGAAADRSFHLAVFC